MRYAVTDMSVVVTPRARSTSGLPLFNVPQSNKYSFTAAGDCTAGLGAKMPANIDTSNVINIGMRKTVRLAED